MIVGMAAGYGPAVQGAFISFTFVAVSPSLQCVLELCNRFSRHTLVLHCMPEINPGPDAWQLAMRAGGLVSVEPASVEGSNRADPVRTCSSGAHGHRSRKTEADDS